MPVEIIRRHASPSILASSRVSLKYGFLRNPTTIDRAAARGAHALGYHGSVSRADHPELEHAYEQQVKPDVEQARNDQEYQRRAGIPKRPHNGVYPVVRRHAYRAGARRAHVGGGVFQEVFRGVHHLHQKSGERHGDYGYHSSERDYDIRGVGDQFADFLVHSRAKPLGYQYAGSHGKPYAQRAEKVGEASCRAHRRKLVRAEVLPDDDGIHDVV